MEIASIKGDTVILLYHPADTAAEVGQQFAIRESPEGGEGEAEPQEGGEGLVVQVVSNDTLEYAGLQQENIQKIIEERIAEVERPLDLESGMEEIKNLKVATAKIRKQIRGDEWIRWGGWIPSRNVDIQLIGPNELIENIDSLSEPSVPLRSFSSFDGTSLRHDGPGLDMISVVTGVKGSGKSHLAKLMAHALNESNVPCVIYDLNGEYTELPGAQVLRWGKNFIPNLAEVGYGILDTVIEAVYALPENSRNVLNVRLPQIFAGRRQYCEREGIEFSIDIDYLRGQDWSGNKKVQRAIEDRLRIVGNSGLFRMSKKTGPKYSSLANAYETANSENRPVVFDMREMSTGLRMALVRAMNRRLEDICGNESDGEERYPYVFFEEAHFYVTDRNILDLITRARHIGLASVFITNTPQELPEAVFRQLDNLFLLGLSHRDDIRSVGKNSFTDEDTIESFATRMPEEHGLFIGKVTDRYPLVVSIDDLPEEMPATGETRSTWDRMSNQQSGQLESAQDGEAPGEDETPPSGDEEDSSEAEDDLPF